MKASLSGTRWRLALVWSVCLALLVGLIAVFGELRFENESSYTAEFINGSRSGTRELRPYRRRRGRQGYLHLGQGRCDGRSQLHC